MPAPQYELARIIEQLDEIIACLNCGEHAKGKQAKREKKPDDGS